MKTLLNNLLKLQSLQFGETKDVNAAKVIAELRSRIPTQIIGHYDRLRVRNKKGIAAVRNQVCTGCHMRVPLAVIMTLKHEDDIQLCGNCGRYLHLPEETEAAPPAEPPQTKQGRSERKISRSAAT